MRQQGQTLKLTDFCLFRKCAVARITNMFDSTNGTQILKKRKITTLFKRERECTVATGATDVLQSAQILF